MQRGQAFYANFLGCKTYEGKTIFKNRLAVGLKQIMSCGDVVPCEHHRAVEVCWIARRVHNKACFEICNTRAFCLPESATILFSAILHAKTRGFTLKKILML